MYKHLKTPCVYVAENENGNENMRHNFILIQLAGSFLELLDQGGVATIRFVPARKMTIFRSDLASVGKNSPLF